MAGNAQLTSITPVKPKVIENEQIHVYVPIATTTSTGIASFDSKEFNVNKGHVSLKYSLSKIVELADPLTRPSLIKLLDDEFEYTGETSTLEGIESTTAEVRLKRTKLDALERPELVMLDKNDFEIEDRNADYYNYKIRRKNPLDAETLVHLSDSDFTYDDSNGIVSVVWPKAKDGVAGLVEIGADGYLLFDDNDKLVVNFNALYTKIDEELDLDNRITKEAIGLDKVANKAFDEYVYTDFGDSMRATFDELFAKKLDKTTWNTLFADWKAKSDAINTPHSWLVYLDGQNESLQEAFAAAGMYLGVFEDLNELQTKYPASEKTKNATAYVLETNTYWAVKDNGGYSWYNTNKADISFYEAMSTNADDFKANGIASPGSTGKWAQSNHVHPTDESRLSKSIYQQSNIIITSNEPTDNDFVVELWEKDADGKPVDNPDLNLNINVPYVRTAKYLHNWNGNEVNFLTPNNEYYWAGDGEEFAGLDIDSIPNGALLIVDDGENAEAGTSISKTELETKGINLDLASKDRFVITTIDTAITGAPLTIHTSTNGDKYYVKSIDLGTEDGLFVVTKVTDNGTTLGVTTVGENQVIVGNENGAPSASRLNYKNVLNTNALGTSEVTLDANRLLISKDDNAVSTYNTGEVINTILVSDGYNGITKLVPNNSLGVVAGAYPLIMENSGKVKTSPISMNNVLTVSDIQPNKLLISVANQGNELGQFDSGSVEDILLASDGNGGIKTITLPKNQLVISGANGNVTTLASDTSHAGYYYGVSQFGTPTMIAPPIFPLSLPVQTLNSNPESAQANTVLVFADPGTDYKDGCLYLY